MWICALVFHIAVISRCRKYEITYRYTQFASSRNRIILLDSLDSFVNYFQYAAATATIECDNLPINQSTYTPYIDKTQT